MYIKSTASKRRSPIRTLTQELEIMELHSNEGPFLDGIDPDVLGYVHDLIRKFTSFSPNSSARLESRQGALEVLSKMVKLRACNHSNAKVAKALKFLIESTPPLQTDPQ
jgi:hypothetical protein